MNGYESEFNAGAFFGFVIGGLGAYVAYAIGGVFEAKHNETIHWREWQCGNDGAALVADTLCVKADSAAARSVSWRVAEPGKQ